MSSCIDLVNDGAISHFVSFVSTESSETIKGELKI